MTLLIDKYASFGTPVDSAGFRTAFQDLWPSCQRRFLKLETLYDYIESDNKSWEAFKAGDLQQSRKVLRESLARSTPFRERVRLLGIDSHRVRPVRWPLTRYLDWEFLSYEETIRHGQRISLYPAELGIATVGSEVSDFVLFDDYACLLQRYSVRGELEGAVLVKEKGIVQELAGIHTALAAKSLPFQDAVEFIADNTWQLREGAKGAGKG